MTAAPLLSALVPTTPGTRLTVEQTVEQIHEEVAIRPRQARISTGDSSVAAPSATVTDLIVADVDWGWEQLRDYVIRQIEKIHGSVPRQPSFKEKAIFSGFLTRHGRRAPQIARYAFEVSGGYWKNAPISINRFTINSDPYFANPIAVHLAEVESTAQA